MQFSPMDPKFQQNPYPFYDELREKAPVLWSEALQGYCISAYDDIVTVLSEPEFYSSSKFWPILLGEYDPAPEVQPMISLDPPDHLRTRTLAQKAFLPRELKKLQEKIEAICDDLIEHACSVNEDNSFDMTEDFAWLFPVSVIAEMLSIDKSKRREFKTWVDDLLAASNRAIYDDERLAEIKKSSDGLRAYFENIVDERTENPGDDMISSFIKAEVDGDRLSKIEVINLSILLLIGGVETTSNLLGGLFAYYHDHPEDFAAARADRSLVPQLLEEQLRFNSPVQSLFRHTNSEVELSGVKIPANSLVMPMLGSANRDPKKFPNPNKFDLSRDTRGYMTFGGGPHFCMGSYLSKFEAAIAVNKLFDRFKILEPIQATEEVEWIDSYFARGPKALKVRYELA